MKHRAIHILVLAISAGARLAAGELPDWDAKAATAYLDGRMTWWMNWPIASRDHGTFCVSCHTVAPYAMARAALRTGEGPSAVEQQLLDNVTKRVRMWDEVAPFYPDKERGVPKTAESRGTESILNALILVRNEPPKTRLSADARLALDRMWAEQLKTGDAAGAWSWLEFHNAPWEGSSQYYGATLAAIAAGSAPESYRTSHDVQDRIQLLQTYLVSHRDGQTLMNRLFLLWASTKLPKLLPPDDRKRLIEETLGKQQTDGGFSLSAFTGDWKRKDNTPLETRSDGFATGVVAYVLQEAGIPRTEPRMKRALGWLESNQEKPDGRWLAYSLNKQRDLATDIGRFMSDAATAYAVLALTHAD